MHKVPHQYLMCLRVNTKIGLHPVLLYTDVYMCMYVCMYVLAAGMLMFDGRTCTVGLGIDLAEPQIRLDMHRYIVWD